MSFSANLTLKRRAVCHEAEAVFSRADRSGIEAGGAGHAGGGSDPAGRHFGTDVLSLEEAVRRNAVGPGAGAEAAAGRECAVEKAGCGAESGQGDLAGRCHKKVARPALKREAVDYIVSHYDLNMRRACRLVKQSRSMQYYQSVKDPKQALRGRMQEIAQTRVRYGYRRIHVLLKREGWQLGQNQAYRLYSEEQLQLRSKLPKRRKMVVTRQAKLKPTKPNEAWSMDFVSDQLANGMRFRTLTIVDVFSKEALAIDVGQRLRSEHVVAALNRLAAHRGAPQYLFVDNGSEFSGQLLDFWAYHHQVRIDFSRPGKPTDNCHIETFNGSFRDECLNLHWFETMEEAKVIIEAWRRDYNESRPHSTLNDLSPAEFVRQAGLPGPVPV